MNRTLRKRKRENSSTNDDSSLGVVTSIRDALELIETQRMISTSQAFGEAETVWKMISLFPAAKVVFANTKVADKFFQEENDSAEMVEIINKYEMLYRELKECRDFPCCRGCALGKHMSSSLIISKLKPLRQSLGHRKFRKLSACSDLLEVLLQYTDVDVCEGGWDEWDEMSAWINTTVARNPLLALIVDPVFLIIRGNDRDTSSRLDSKRNATHPSWSKCRRSLCGCHTGKHGSSPSSRAAKNSRYVQIARPG